MTIELLKRGH